MKILIAIINILLGLLLAFFGGLNQFMQLLYEVGKSADKQYYYGMSLTQGFIEAILFFIAGLLMIVGAVALIRNKAWATIALPIPLATWILYIFYKMYFSHSEALAWTGGLMGLGAVILLVLLVIEITYLVNKQKAQAPLPPTI